MKAYSQARSSYYFSQHFHPFPDVCRKIDRSGTCLSNLVLVGQLNDDVKRIFISIAESPDFEIEVMETDADHVHFLIRYIPRLSVAQIVRSLKQQSTRQLWLLHGEILRKHYWHQKLLWPDGYFVCSIGEASPQTLRQYIPLEG